MKRGEACAALDARGIDWVCDSLIEGGTLTSVAREAGTSRASLFAWIAADRERVGRVELARIVSAAAWDDKAESALTDAKDPLELAKARELAHHYRWRASKLHPRQYGDRLTADIVPLQEAPLSMLEVGRRLAWIFRQAQNEAEAVPRLLTYERGDESSN